jgi:membrane fusion protein, copper/silver efflux system
MNLTHFTYERRVSPVQLSLFHSSNSPDRRSELRPTKKAYYVVSLLLILPLGFLVVRHMQAEPRTAHRVLYYVDPMHPSYTSDRPGIAPDCGMKLEPVYADEDAIATTSPRAELEGVSINPGIQQSMGIRVVSVEKTFGTRTLRVAGRVTADESRVYRIDAGVDGFVKETREDTIGSHVNKNQRLATIYSPEFISAAGGYFSASQQAQTTVPSENASGAQAQSGVQNWANRLRTLGMSDAQIDELAVTRKTPDSIYIVSPISGFVLVRNIAAGMRFDRNMEFYRIADLSRVWIIADVFNGEDQYLRSGSLARISLQNQRREFLARVSNILPPIDPVNRTIAVRLECENQGFVLRPDMFVNVDFVLPVPSGLSVPIDAVVDSGRSQRVYVEINKGTFEPRQVKIGEQFGERVQVLDGLSEGEKVVGSGTFLVDSETRLRLIGGERQAKRVHAK